MANYRNFIETKKNNVKVVPSLVSQPVSGREAEMVPSSNGAGLTFKVEEISQFKRWLVFGSTGSTMYASAKDITITNLDVVKSLLAKNYKAALDIVLDFSVRNVVKGQTTLLTVLSMALAYDDQTIRIHTGVKQAQYNGMEDNEILDDLLNDADVVSYKLPGSIHRFNFSGKSKLHVMIYDKATNDNYRYVSIDLKSGQMSMLANKPLNISWKEQAVFASDLTEDGIYTVAVDYSLRVKRYALKIAREMHRQSSMLFEDIANIDSQRGWGSIMHKVVKSFYEDMSNIDLAQQFIKYGNRQGWSHRDLLRKAKPVTTNQSMYLRDEEKEKERSKIFAWAVGKLDAFEQVTPSNAKNDRGYIADPMSKLWAADALKHADNAADVAKIVSDYQMPREAVERANTKWLTEKVVWESLLENMPGVALVRNLRNMAEIGLLAPTSDAEKFIINRLTNPNHMKRVHPIQVMQAAVSYNPKIMKDSQAHDTNRSRKSESTKPYKVSQPVMNALNAALHASYKNVEPSNKDIMLVIDISGSMYWNMLPNFFPFYPGEAAGLMALILAHIESNYYPMVFSDNVQPISLSSTDSIENIIVELNRYPMGGTNIGAPVEYARDNNLNIDAFISITDGQVNAGRHTFQLIRQYRDKTGIPSKFVTVAMEANNLTVADPKDPLMLDVVGCSSDTQDTVISYIRGDF